MRSRHLLAVATLGIVVSIIGYQVITASPPEPYVRLASGLPNAPTIRTECRDKTFWQVYTTSDGREIDVPTSYSCPN